MEIITFLPWITGFFGLIVGSFLNVVILRFDTGQGIGGRSHCPHCHHQLTWYELIPVVSYIIQCGACRSCKKSISIQYASVELLTALLFGFSAAVLVSRYNFLSIGQIGILLAMFLVTLSFAIAIAVYDIRHKSVPLVWLLLMSVFGAGFITFQYVFIPSSSFGQWAIVHILGLIIALPFFLIWVVSRGRYMGFADVEIIAWMGLMLGVRLGTSAVLVSFYLGAIIAIGYIIYKKVKGYSYHEIRKIQLPFAPFLLIGFFLVAIIGFDVIALLSHGYL